MSRVNGLSDDALCQIDAFMTPGSLLKTARLRHGMSEEEVAERLKIIPEYVGMLESDDYPALRSPAFARGYVKSYGRLLDLDVAMLEHVFDDMTETSSKARRRVRTRPLQLQKTGIGVIVGLGVTLLLVVALWWWRGETGEFAWDGPRADVQNKLPLTRSVESGVER